MPRKKPTIEIIFEKNLEYNYKFLKSPKECLKPELRDGLFIF